MKTLPTLLCLFSAASLGVLSGWLSRPADHRDPTDGEAVAAVTFTGSSSATTDDHFAETPPGGKRSRAESLELLAEANRRNDTALRDAVLAEWAPYETADGVRAVFEIGNRLEAWQLLHARAGQEPSAAARIASLEAKDPGDAFCNDTVITKCLLTLLLTAPPAALVLERDFYRRGTADLESHFDNGDLPAVGSGDMLETLSDFRDSSLRDRLVRQLVSADRLDPGKALDWAATRQDMGNRQSFSASILSHWLDHDPDVAGTYVADRFDGSDNSRLLVREFLAGIVRRSPEKMLAWMRQQDRELLAKVAPVKFHGLMPDEEASLATQLGEEFPEFAPVPTTDPIEANDFPQAWPPTTKAGAVAWLKGHNKSWGAHLGPEVWTPDSMTEVLDLLSDLPGQSRESIMREMASTWARKAPEEAITWAAVLPDQECIGIAESALASWMNNAPGDARAYVAAIPESEFRAYAVELTVRDLCPQDPDAAEQWLLGLEPDLARDAGLRELANDFLVYRGTPQIDGVRRERAVRLFQQVEDPVIRAEGLETSLRKLGERDPDRALELIDGSGLPDEITAGLQTQARNSLENRRKYELKRKAKQAQKTDGP